MAREILEASELPVVFLNIAGYFMDNFLTMFAVPLQAARTLALPYDHRMSFLDATDFGEARAAVLLSPDHRHVGKTYHLDNGHDVLLFSEVAVLLSEVLGEEIRYDGTPEIRRPRLPAGAARQDPASLVHRARAGPQGRAPRLTRPFSYTLRVSGKGVAWTSTCVKCGTS